MPYQGERASKVSHSDIVKNPEVRAFLESCEHITEPSEEEGRAVASGFIEPPSGPGAMVLPERVIATDGSSYESSIDDRFPSTKVGYVKVGSVLIDMVQFNSLRVEEGRFVDPFRVAKLQRNNDSLTFSMPSANVILKGKSSLRDSFRAVIDEHLYSAKTRFVADDPGTSLRTTLFHMAARRAGPHGTQDPARLLLHLCPSCKHPDVEVKDIPGPQHCPECEAEVYPADCLRVWEEVADFQSNVEAFNRFMMLVEHMIPMHYLRFLVEKSPASLSSLAFFVDGPLAVFGNGAWLHGSIMKFLGEVRARMAELGQPNVLVIGLQKTGQVVDHVQVINRFIPSNRVFAIDDEYRYKYINAGKTPSGNGFGHETYYGQDFIFKTASGKVFVLGVPYPFESKAPAGIDFITAKTEIARYGDLGRALALVSHFETDLYQNALIPVALAHRYTSISLMPGGRVLDLLTRRAFEADR